MPENIFADEWRDCLEAHYMHVIRNNDRVTLPSLTLVMHQAGFNDSELAELRVRATMHVDQVGEDFVPDLDVLKSAPEAVVVAIAAPPTNTPAEVVSAVDVPDTLPTEPLTDMPVEAEGVVIADIPEIPEAVIEAVSDDSLMEDDIDERELDEEPLEEIPEEPEDDPDAPQQLSLF